jgi:lipopolysaccharide export LptBFGC system permease protein LptF
MSIHVAAVTRQIYYSPRHGKRRSKMLETIAVVLVVLWLLGFVSSYTMGGFIHVLLVLAVVVILIRVIRGRSL